MNIAEILKYCPKGTKLYSPLYGDVILDSVLLENGNFPIIIKDGKGYEHILTKQGYYVYDIPNVECVLFPSKDQRDWSKFRLPVKRGDIMMSIDESYPFISNGIITKEGGLEYICGVATKASNTFCISRLNGSCTLWTDEFCIPASEEAKKELFDKMAEAGYRWNADTLELEKIEPKFKDGDVVINSHGNVCLVSEVLATKIRVAAVLLTNNYLNTPDYNTFCDINKITLVSDDNKHRLFSALVREGYKYDKKQHKLIKREFKPYDKVLVRDDVKDFWKTDIYLSYVEKGCYHYRCTTGHYRLCIPYEGNEYLLGTTDSPT